MNIIENIDWVVLLFVNDWHTPLLDSIFKIISNKYTWIPLYVLLAIVFIKKLGVKNGLILVGGALLCMVLTDQISAKILKPLFERPRPCHTIVGQTSLWLPNGCGGLYGFVSSHAANSTGIAIFSILVFTRKIKGKLATPFALLLLSYAFLIGLSRIYLGRHFPTDVICGALLGIVIAVLVFAVFNKWLVKNQS